MVTTHDIVVNVTRGRVVGQTPHMDIINRGGMKEMKRIADSGFEIPISDRTRRGLN